jgi:hypothetical protein
MDWRDFVVWTGATAILLSARGVVARQLPPVPLHAGARVALGSRGTVPSEDGGAIRLAGLVPVTRTRLMALDNGNTRFALDVEHVRVRRELFLLVGGQALRQQGGSLGSSTFHLTRVQAERLTPEHGLALAERRPLGRGLAAVWSWPEPTVPTRVQVVLTAHEEPVAFWLSHDRFAFRARDRRTGLVVETPPPGALAGPTTRIELASGGQQAAFFDLETLRLPPGLHDVDCRLSLTLEGARAHERWDWLTTGRLVLPVV